MHFLKVEDGGNAVSWLDKIPFPLKVNGWGAARWSPDGQRLYVGGAGALGTIFMPCASEKLRQYFQGCKDKQKNDSLPVGDIEHPAGIGVWSSDGAEIVTSSFQGQPNVWSPSTGKVDAKLADVVASVVKPSTEPTEKLGFGSDRTVTSVALSSSEKKLVAVGNSAGFITVTRSDSSADEPIRKLGGPGYTPSQIYFNPVNDNQLLAIYQNRALLWNVKTATQTPLSQDRGMVMQAAFDPKGRFVATGSNDATVRLFGLGEDGVTETLELRGHKGPVFAVDVASDGTIISGSADGSLRFWRKEPALTLREPRGYETKDMENLKRLAADNLPFVGLRGRQNLTPQRDSVLVHQRLPQELGEDQRPHPSTSGARGSIRPIWSMSCLR